MSSWWLFFCLVCFVFFFNLVFYSICIWSSEGKGGVGAVPWQQCACLPVWTFVSSPNLSGWCWEKKAQSCIRSRAVLIYSNNIQGNLWKRAHRWGRPTWCFVLLPSCPCHYKTPHQPITSLFLCCLCHCGGGMSCLDGMCSAITLWLLRGIVWGQGHMAQSLNKKWETVEVFALPLCSRNWI